MRSIFLRNSTPTVKENTVSANAKNFFTTIPEKNANLNFFAIKWKKQWVISWQLDSEIGSRVRVEMRI